MLYTRPRGTRRIPYRIGSVHIRGKREQYRLFRYADTWGYAAACRLVRTQRRREIQQASRRRNRRQ